MDRSRAARREAVVALYESEYASLLRLARLLERDPVQAEDLVQEAFLRVYKAYGRLEDGDSARAYLRKTLVNLTATHAKRAEMMRRRRPLPEPDAPSAEEYAVVDATREQVVAALHALSPRQRQCMVLRHYAGMSESQIAEETGCSIGSVRTHIKRGTAQLRNLLPAPAREATA